MADVITDSIAVTESIEALVPYEAGKPIEALVREKGVSHAIKLASNENSLGPSPKVVEALRLHATAIHRYPDASAFRLRRALSEQLGVKHSEIIHGAGSNEIIELVVRTFTTERAHIIFGEPGFSMYRIVCMAHSVPFTAVPVRDWAHDVDAMLAAVRPETRVLLIDNPNNPTGTYVPRPALERLLRELPERVIVVLDEAYAEYVDAPDFADGIGLRPLRKNLVILRTFSKIHALAGLRVGYGIAPERLIGYMDRIRAPFNVGVLGQEAALAALGDIEHVARSRAMNSAGRDFLASALRSRGFSPVPSQANFVLVDFKRPARPLYEALLDRGLIVRPFGSLPTCLRITVGTQEENQIFLDALDAGLKGVSAPGPSAISASNNA